MLPMGLAAIPVPWDNTLLRDSRGCSQLGHPLGSVPYIVLAVGSVPVEPVLGGGSRRTRSLCQGGQEGPWTRLSPCVGCEGPGAGGGQRLSAR